MIPGLVNVAENELERSTMLFLWEFINYFDWAMASSSQTVNVYQAG